MTREEAIKVLNMVEAHGLADKAKCIAIKALEQDPCEDCISRQATVERLCKVAEFMNEKREGLGSPYVMAALFIQDNKDEFPSVTPQYTDAEIQKMQEMEQAEIQNAYELGKIEQPKMGRWSRKLIRNEKGGCIGAEMICSECGQDNRHDEYMKFCPNCGCRMIEPQKSEG